MGRNAQRRRAARDAEKAARVGVQHKPQPPKRRGFRKISLQQAINRGLIKVKKVADPGPGVPVIQVNGDKNVPSTDALPR